MHPEAGDSGSGTLYVVATPIGNLRDITLRALDVLGAVQLVAAEDTRSAARLLSHYSIAVPVVSLHAHNERTASRRVIRELHEGRSVALVTDAGTPAVSDPGAHLVREARSEGVRVVPVPGANAALCAFSAAGIESTRFLFCGFLPSKAAARRRELEELRGVPWTLVFYEAPHRIADTLRDLGAELGAERGIVIGRELTKAFETIHACTLAEAPAWVEADANRERGEFVLLVEGNTGASRRPAEGCDGVRALRLLLEALPLGQAASLAAAISGEPRKALYAEGVAMQKARGRS